MIHYDCPICGSGEIWTKSKQDENETTEIECENGHVGTISMSDSKSEADR